MPPLAEITQLIVFGVLALAVVVGALGVVMLPDVVYAPSRLGGVCLSVAGLYLMLNASFIAAAQILIYVGAVNVLILFAIMLVNKKEAMGASPGVGLRRVLSTGVCIGLFALLLRVAFSTPWATPGPAAIGEDAVIRLGEHFFSDYLLPFELASVLLLMAMIGAIVLARRDVLATDIGTGESVDQGLIEKARTPLLMEKP